MVRWPCWVSSCSPLRCLSPGHTHSPEAHFSPDGQSLALALDSSSVYLIDVQAVRPRLVVDGTVPEGWESRTVRIVTDHDRSDLLVITGASREVPDETADGGIRYEYSFQYHYFTWEGVALPDAPDPLWETCPGSLSPDGRYVAQQAGEPIGTLYLDDWMPEDPWAAVVIARIENCEPIFRVRSAHMGPAYLSHYLSSKWAGDWLSNSAGYVITVAGGHALVRVAPTPQLVTLPSWGDIPATASSGDGRYFAYGAAGVYDAWEDRWIVPGFGGQQEVVFFAWGEDHTEVLYRVTGYYGEAGVKWFLLDPIIEFPPFSDEIAFRVSGEECASLYEGPRADTPALGCAPDGARVTLAVPDVVPTEQCGVTCYPSVRNEYDGWYVYVRTEGGAEGWVSNEFLVHD